MAQNAEQFGEKGTVWERVKDHRAECCASTVPCDYHQGCIDVLDAILSQPTTGSDLIMAERHRQIQDEGWTAEGDDGYSRGELLAAARCYTTAGTIKGATEPRQGVHVPWEWPLTWAPSWWKPEGHCRDSWEGTGPSVRDLAKAGALIAAEIDRLQRAPLFARPQDGDS